MERWEIVSLDKENRMVGATRGHVVEPFLDENSAEPPSLCGRGDADDVDLSAEPSESSMELGPAGADELLTLPSHEKAIRIEPGRRLPSLQLDEIDIALLGVVGERSSIEVEPCSLVDTGPECLEPHSWWEARGALVWERPFQQQDRAFKHEAFKRHRIMDSYVPSPGSKLKPDLACKLPCSEELGVGWVATEGEHLEITSSHLGLGIGGRLVADQVPRRIAGLERSHHLLWKCLHLVGKRPGRRRVDEDGDLVGVKLVSRSPEAGHIFRLPTRWLRSAWWEGRGHRVGGQRSSPNGSGRSSLGQRRTCALSITGLPSSCLRRPSCRRNAPMFE